MAEKTFNQIFNGYYRNTNKDGLPKKSGVYIVQSCIYDSKKNAVDLKMLIYIGKADNINERVLNHEKFEKWEKELKTEEELCFSYSEISSLFNERVEAALINANRPIVNIEYKNYFPFDKTIVSSSGKYLRLKEKIIVLKH